MDSYGLMALPLAAFLAWIFNKNVFQRVLVLLLLFGMGYLNIFQTRQYIHGAMHWADMTFGAYVEGFGKKRATKAYYDALRKYDTEKAKKGIYVYEEKD